MAIKGLTSAEASRRLERDGANALPEAPAVTLTERFVKQFLSPLIYILLAALAIDLFLWWQEGMHGVPIEGLTILLILLANAGLGVWQENKSEQALARIKAMAAPKAAVMRNGHLVKIAATDLVLGDVFRVEAGDRIPADATLLNSDRLSADESLLTGESLPVEKQNSEALFSGTLCVRGNGFAEVTGTGLQSSMGKLASLLEGVVSEKSPLEKRLTQFGNQIAIVVLSLAVLILVVGLGVTGTSHFSTIFLFAVALAVAAVPESLPAVLTLTMALGVERMAGRRAVVRKLSAVESLGSVTIIATDKTGTLTENKMMVEKVDTEEEAEAYLAMKLVNDADPETGIGDPMDTGLLNYLKAKAPQVHKSTEPKVIDKKPFDSAWKYMRVTIEHNGSEVHYLKGAPDVLLNMCTLSEQQKQNAQEKISSYAKEGFRMLALAKGEAGDKEQALQWLGLVLFWDPPRQEVPAAISEAQQAGIRVMMITGDHPETARTIAKRIGIETDQVITGQVMEAMDDAALATAVKTTNVFARVKPEHKLRIVNLLKAAGEIVAMTGDGVNDAPALKSADVGVAMGQRGSDVSREVADLVLLDDNFATIVDAVTEGRSIYENIQKFIRTLFSTNLSECLLIAAGALIAFTMAGVSGSELILPLTAVQILWINLLTDSLPALAIATDQNRNVMALPPRSPKEPLLDKKSLSFIVGLGCLGGLLALSALLMLPRLGFDQMMTQSWIFSFVVLVQLSFVLPARRVRLASESNNWVWAAVISCALLQFFAMFYTGLHQWLGITSLTWGPLIVMFLLVVAAGFVAYLYAGKLQTQDKNMLI